MPALLQNNAFQLSGLRLRDEVATEEASAPLFSRFSDEELATSLVELAIDLRKPGPSFYQPLADTVGLPLGEMMASPFALRAVAQAAQTGGFAVHYETRKIFSWPSDICGDQSVAEERHGRWSNGALITGKYQGFCQDSALTVFNPNYSGKWGPHELAHLTASFFWSSEMSKWALYIGAKLNELVPVVLWYGLDEVMRLDGAGFDRKRDALSPNPSVEEAKWLHADTDKLYMLAKKTCHNLRSAADHFHREMDAIDREIETGRQVRIDTDPNLDSSSDATAYVVGHWKRLKSRSFQTFATQFLSPGRDYYQTISSYRESVYQHLNTLLFSDLVLDLSQLKTLQKGRALRDMVSRVFTSRTAQPTAFTRLLPQAQSDYLRANASENIDLMQWQTVILESLKNDNDPCSEIGLIHEPALYTQEQLIEGIEQIIPVTFKVIQKRLAPESLVHEFIQSPFFRQRGTLLKRLSLFLPPIAVAAERDLFSLEEQIFVATSRHDQTERLSAHWDETLSGAEMKLFSNTAFNRLDLNYDVAEFHYEMLIGNDQFPLPEKSTEVSYLIGRYFEQVSLLPLHRELADLWELMKQRTFTVSEATDAIVALNLKSRKGWPDSAEAWIAEMMTAGALGALPSIE